MQSVAPHHMLEPPGLWNSYNTGTELLNCSRHSSACSFELLKPQAVRAQAAATFAGRPMPSAVKLSTESLRSWCDGLSSRSFVVFATRGEMVMGNFASLLGIFRISNKQLRRKEGVAAHHAAERRREVSWRHLPRLKISMGSAMISCTVLYSADI